MNKIVVAGIGTDVGKTVASAVLVEALQGDYWKPIQCGNLQEGDSHRIAQLVSHSQMIIHEEVYRFKAPVSPHQAAHLEEISICACEYPKTERPLVIECAGGLMVPLSDQLMQIDFMLPWECRWVLVSKHYLGSINHTILSVEMLKQRKVKLAGIIFNGKQSEFSEKVILDYAQVPCLGRLLPEWVFTKRTIKKYAQSWKKNLHEHLTIT